MMTKQEFTLDGIDEVINAMDALSPEQLLKVVIAIERKALNTTIVQPLRSAIPNVSLTSGIGITKEKGSNRTAYRAGIKISKRKDLNILPEGVILLLLEAGTELRTTKKGANRGQINGRSIMAPIIESNAEDVITKFKEMFAEEADKIIARKLKRLNKQ
ncbi:MAG: hypothetical protein LLG13_11025 [Bacteroidales bacterium]|nr:hypothetical protein [Bacteroidales bacterium]